ncbi:histidine phosphatase family protein [Chishuiella sp.]|uniref:SixA phosphatase family protein n=1 Tax=Chishuiella sp. TaxID=1969467 RepID=UPI0028AFA7E1|nr:histidine phosphatase family protein [Chishuiella sp.]
MKNIFFIRHAKSDWHQNISDELRKISEKGKFKTELIANYIQTNLNLSFDKIYTSKAVRAKETSEIVQNILFPTQKVEVVDELYTFSNFLLDSWIRKLDNKLENILIFGHNPAFTELINQLGDKNIYNLSTSGFAWLQFDNENWKSIIKGKTIKIILPKDIK